MVVHTQYALTGCGEEEVENWQIKAEYSADERKKPVHVRVFGQQQRTCGCEGKARYSAVRAD